MPLGFRQNENKNLSQLVQKKFYTSSQLEVMVVFDLTITFFFVFVVGKKRKKKCWLGKSVLLLELLLELELLWLVISSERYIL